MSNKLVLLAVLAPLAVAPFAGSAEAQTKPCSQQMAQSFDRGTNPGAIGEKAPAGGLQTAQSFDRGTNPGAIGEKAPAGGVQTAQSFDRGTNPSSVGGKDAAGSSNKTVLAMADTTDCR